MQTFSCEMACYWRVVAEELLLKSCCWRRVGVELGQCGPLLYPVSSAFLPWFVIFTSFELNIICECQVIKNKFSSMVWIHQVHTLMSSQSSKLSKGGHFPILNLFTIFYNCPPNECQWKSLSYRFLFKLEHFGVSPVFQLTVPNRIKIPKALLC
jgi:hypothetical protein